eukprot:12087966-Karenia_brevis.AAC.1
MKSYCTNSSQGGDPTRREDSNSHKGKRLFLNNEVDCPSTWLFNLVVQNSLFPSRELHFRPSGGVPPWEEFVQ